jgi:hypothetical protein
MARVLIAANAVVLATTSSRAMADPVVETVGREVVMVVEKVEEEMEALRG